MSTQGLMYLRNVQGRARKQLSEFKNLKIIPFKKDFFIITEMLFSFKCFFLEKFSNLCSLRVNKQIV